MLPCILVNNDFHNAFRSSASCVTTELTFVKRKRIYNIVISVFVLFENKYEAGVVLSLV